ncbi:Imm64 family immunity protein [Paenibacillus sp. DMB5]|uniref:Imm64 family immunity protein n=1 Tax=Paenibacillus sp. DMB5 TaxID=1780103 RepID=UPI00076DE4C9|nr:Imm64 family immunity protein [Paenibacillus sp. DMB5]KUP24489.1 hypothetical protein AWJ19_22470 [Paenibacillus sp. DMB5]
MGSNINIGLVYSDSSNIEDRIKKLLDLLKERNSQIEFVKYCEDADGDNWTELNNPLINDIMLGEISMSYYGQIQLCFDLFQYARLSAEIKIDKHEDYWGLLLSLDEETLLPNYSMQTLEKATNSIIDFIEEIYPILKFDYAICDHEAEIELSPNEFKPENYSLSFLPDLSKASLSIRKSNWHINGLTER